MSFWDHLDVLRGTLFRSIGAIVLVSIVFLAIPERLFKAVLWPTTPDFVLYKWLGLDFSMTLINIEVSAQFFVHLKISILMAAIVAFPYVIWEIWKFIAPALYDNEKKAVRKAFGMSSFLFYLGVAVGYFIVLPVCLMFFMNYTVSDTVQNTISLSSYISLFTSMVFLIGLLNLCALLGIQFFKVDHLFIYKTKECIKSIRVKLCSPASSHLIHNIFRIKYSGYIEYAG